MDLRRFEAVPLARIQGWSGIPPATPLFESLVTVQNLPFVDALRERGDRLGVESPGYIERTHYPITVTAVPGTALVIKIGFDARRFAAHAFERTVGHLGALLRAMADDPERRVDDLPWMLDGERRARSYRTMGHGRAPNVHGLTSRTSTGSTSASSTC